MTPAALVGRAGRWFSSVSYIPYQKATWKSLTGVSQIIQGHQPTQVSSALWALGTLRHVHHCYSLQWIQTGSLLSIFIMIPSGSALAGFCNENPAQSTLWHAASSLKIAQWHTATITHINALHCAVWRDALSPSSGSSHRPARGGTAGKSWPFPKDKVQC